MHDRGAFGRLTVFSRFRQMNERIDSVKLRPYIDPKEFTFEEAADAFRYMDGRSHVGKVVIQVSKD